MNENENKNIDQHQLAESVSKSIPYDFFDMFLVKVLDPIKVVKEFSKPVAKSEAKKDANDIEAVDYEEVEKEEKEVDSDYRKGIILKLPRNMEDFKIGDTVLFLDRCGRPFDLLKDSKLVKYYDIIAIER